MKPPGRLRVNNLDLWSLFQAAAAAAPDRVAVEFGAQSVSYRELRDHAIALCELLAERGVGRHDRVAAMLANSPLFVALYLAIAALGATAVPINTRLAAPEVEALLREARPRLVVADERFEDRIAGSTDTVRIAAGELARDLRHEAGRTHESRYQFAAVDPSDPCVIFYTSGSTGRPKGVVRNQQNVCWTALTAMWIQDFWYDAVLLAPLPLFHISGWETKCLCCLLAGGRVVLTERFDAEETLSLVERHQVTHVFLVPTMTHDLVRAGLEGRALRSLRYWQSGTAPLPRELREEVVRRLPHVHFWITYGTTEAGIVSFFENTQRNPAPGCVGRVVPSVHVRIVDDEGRDAPAGEPGEIWCASPMVAAGLFAGEGASPTPLANDQNWIATGDLGHLDSEGFLFVSGRKKDVIITGGENVVAVEVEQAIKSHPAVSEAAVIGTPDPRWGEMVTAFVVPAPGASLTVGEVDRHCRARLAGYKCPRRIELVDSLPKTSIGKVAKGALREIAAASAPPPAA